MSPWKAFLREATSIFEPARQQMTEEELRSGTVTEPRTVSPSLLASASSDTKYLEALTFGAAL